MSNQPSPSSLPNGIFMLVVLPPYFVEGIVLCLDAEERERKKLAPFDGDVKKRWDDEFVPYRNNLNTHVFSGDVASFKAFAAQNQNYFGKEYHRIRDLPDDLCQRLLHEIAEERMRYEAEQMMPLSPIRERHEA